MPVTDAFELQSEHPISRLGLVLQRFAHPCGAIHLHLARQDAHRAFAVSFRTLPDDSSGLPHILEHLALCGSRRYPVRDPFFLMLRRSLQTFMNAFTYPDMTCYPFATQVDRDFDNLLGIYLDATFDPLLDPRDFAQEGWRLEPTTFPLPEGSDPAAVTDWAFKGVVFNEMKGAMGSTDSILFQALKQQLLPDTRYRYNSGGEPLDIPALRYEDLVAFHRDHYCGANACFATYGAIDLASLHERLLPYLAAHPGTAQPLAELQPALAGAVVHDVPVPLDEGQDPVDVGAVSCCWLWGETTDLDEVLLAELTDRILFGHSAAPLRLAIESSRLARSCGGSGYMAFLRNGVFAVEAEGIDPARYDEFEPLVRGELQRLAVEGLPEAEVQAALHQLELARRRIGGDGMPFGLQLCLRGIMAWNHGRDPAAVLDQDEAIARLKQRVARPGFWQEHLRHRLLELDDRVLLRARPSNGYHQEREERERTMLAARMATIDEAGKRRLAREADELLQRQASPGDVTILPRLELEDVPRAMRWAESAEVATGLSCFTQPTNGLLHTIVALPLPADLSADDLQLLPLLGDLVGELGVGDDDYRAWSHRLTACCGGLSAWHRLQSDPRDLARQRGLFFLEIRGLSERSATFQPLLRRCLDEQRFDEHERLAEILAEELNDQQGRLLSSGMDFAVAAAMRGLGGVAGLSHDLSGLGRFLRLRRWVREEQAEGLAGRLAVMWRRIAAGPHHLAVIGDDATDPGLQRSLAALWQDHRASDLRGPLPDPILPTGSAVPATAFTTASAVSYCALALAGVPPLHPDAPALSVACQYLKDEVLHRRIREQGGAYGAQASYRSNAGVVTLASYRDPRLDATYEDFAAGLLGLRSIPDDPEPLRCAILGRIARIDAPSSPSGEGRKRFCADLLGNGPAEVERYRAGLLATTCADIRRVAETWLDPERAVRAVVTGSDALQASRSTWEQVSLS